jgi:hypothetical protein
VLGETSKLPGMEDYRLKLGPDISAMEISPSPSIKFHGFDNLQLICPSLGVISKLWMEIKMTKQGEALGSA